MDIIIADNQDITFLGIKALLKSMGYHTVKRVINRTNLIEELLYCPDALVILDYTLFDFPDVALLLVAQSRFQKAKWLIFGDDLTNEVLRRLIVNEKNFGIIGKNAPSNEISQAIEVSLSGSRYISKDIQTALNGSSSTTAAMGSLTPTEKEILALIAQGKTSKDIANERYSSVNTVVTHRKNIFRKLGVNNIYEASRCAFRMGLVNASEYYI